MSVTLRPDPNRWPDCLAPTDDTVARSLAAAAQAAADRGIGPEPVSPEKEVAWIVTGHQARLWHPGILAKFVAARAMADSARPVVHLVVDHDAHPTLELEVPHVTGDRAQVQTLELAETAVDVPTGWQAPVDAGQVQSRLAAAAAEIGGVMGERLTALADAWTPVGEPKCLADQVVAVLSQWIEPVAGPVMVATVSDLLATDAWAEVETAILENPAGCVRAYNEAVAESPSAGLRPLLDGAGRVELPVWAVGRDRPRQTVFAEVDSGELLLGTGQTLDRSDWTLAPRALTLTAMIRRGGGLFVHGTGGGLYEPVADAWWQSWRGELAGGFTVASADVYLDLGVPVAEPEELARAQWWAHHLPHNLDRALELTGPRIDEKRKLIETMDIDRDPVRRARAFDRIHAINDVLAAEHPQPLTEAQAQLARARAGVANRTVAARRDWAVGLYPAEAIVVMAEAIRQPLAEARDATVGGRS
ncbi:MAG: hypothetical protein R3336_03395 [Phycisphaeraceae bacterium]|nr:hypothetical protein [Phycisphaeraceae bacterium]